MKEIYKIKVLKWNEHNKNPKRHFKKTMIEHSLISDAKINALPLSNKWLFINLLLICGDHANDTITLTQRQVNDILTTREGAHNALDRLQSFQLVTYEKIALIEEKRKEEKRSEEKRSEKKRISSESKNLEGPIINSTAENREIWECYLNAFRNRYGVDPVRNATVNAQISQLRQRLGKNEAMEVIRFFLKHNDSFYLKKTHSIGLCLKDCETLRTQMLRNTPITQTMVRSFEKSQTMQQTLKEIDEEGL